VTEAGFRAGLDDDLGFVLTAVDRAMGRILTPISGSVNGETVTTLYQD